MPELPEVQTTVNDLNKKIIGRKITGIWFDAPKLIKEIKPEELKNKIKGLKIEKIERRGKNILIYLTKKSKVPAASASWRSCGAGKSQNYILLIHQKMTGHLLVGKWKITKVKSRKWKVKSKIKDDLDEKVNSYIHMIFYLDDNRQLALSDLRKFAKVVFGKKEEVENLPEIKKLGPEPLTKDFTFDKFKALIKKQRRGIKQVLIDQNIIAGIGNIYSDEILWLAKVHPLFPANKLNEKQIKGIYSAMKKILNKALKLRGISVSDYRDTSGKAGFYGEKRFVYQKEGNPCSICGGAIKRIKIGGRSAHYCPVCQKIEAEPR